MSDASPTGRIWDPDLALQGVDGCAEDLRELLDIFLRQVPKLLSDIRDSLEKSDPKRLHLAAHTLKGSLQILFADDACAVAAEMEAVGHNGHTTNGLELLSALELRLARLTASVQAFLETL